MTHRLSYILPLRTGKPADADLVDYLRWLAGRVEDLLVVDGSPPPVYAAHQAAFPAAARHLPVDPARRTRNGKVGGVLTGLAAARCDSVVVADDDVRYDDDALAAVGRSLAEYDAVAPQNFYVPLNLPARYDTARTLVHRGLGRDFPGTLGVDRARLLTAGGYRGDVLFENLELLRTVAAAGGRVRWAPEILVARRPPSTSQFLDQRVRQAYDEFARPAHLVISLAVLPALLSAIVGRRWSALLFAAAAVCVEAEYGRRRAGGRRVFPVSSTALAPLWVLERGLCMWVAVSWRLRGGVPYSGARLRHAASSPRQLAEKLRRPQ